VNDVTETVSVEPVVLHLDVPADSSYSVLLRAALAALAARHGFTLDRIEDLRLAGTEAFGLVVLRARSDATIHITVTSTTDAIEVRATAPSVESRAHAGGPGSLGWTLLTSLVDQLAEVEHDGEPGVWLSIRSDQASPVPPRAAPLSPSDESARG